MADYVLGRFSEEDRNYVEDAIKDAMQACALMVWDETDKAMNDYNSKKREIEEK